MRTLPFGIAILSISLQSCINSSENELSPDDLSASSRVAVVCTNLQLAPTNYVGQGRDIASSYNSIFVVGNSSTPGGYSLFRWNGSGWTGYGGGTMRVAVAAETPWIVNNVGEIHMHNGRWNRIYGLLASDIGANYYGEIVAVGKYSGVDGGYVYSRSGTSWIQLGTIKALAVAKGTQTWIIDVGGNVQYWNGSGWVLVPGIKGIDVGVNLDEDVTVVSNEVAPSGDNYLYWYNWNYSTPGCWKRVVDQTNNFVSARRVAGNTFNKLTNAYVRNSMSIHTGIYFE